MKVFQISWQNSQNVQENDEKILESKLEKLFCCYFSLI